MNENRQAADNNANAKATVISMRVLIWAIAHKQISKYGQKKWQKIDEMVHEQYKLVYC